MCYNLKKVLIYGGNNMKFLLVSFNAKFVHSSLALRYIKEFCTEYKNNIEILELTINHDENQIIKSIYKKQPEVIGFSCYIWNMTYISSIIPTLRKLLPNTKFILGGPEVSYDSRNLLNTLPIDVLMEGEGEVTWKEYLDYFTKNTIQLCDIEGIIYKLDNEIIVNAPRKPIDMSLLPFVYKDMTELKHKIIYYEASRGCPFSCQYCLSSVEKGVRFLPLERVLGDMDYFLENKVPQVKFVDRTFNAKKTFAIAIWKYIIEHDNGITNFHFEIAGEMLTNDMIELLKVAREGLIQFEIGVQSTNLDTLKAIKRPLPFEEIKKISQQIAIYHNIHQHLDLIVGLPYEDYVTFKKSFNEVIAIRPEQLQLGFLKVLKGSGLYKDAKKYGIVYKEFPPYEVLYTNYISYDEVLLLHTIEEMLERYYNSGRFNHSLEYLFELFESEFELFERMALFWEEENYDKVAHKKSAYYLILLEFGQTLDNCNIELLKELIRWDWLTHENLKDDYKILNTIDQTIYKADIHDNLKNDIWLENINQDYISITPKQRLRNMRIEFFKYNVFDNNENKLGTLLREPIGVLFYYSYGKNQAEITILTEDL